MIDSLKALWSRLDPRSEGIWADPVFKALETLYVDRYQSGRLSMGLGLALSNDLKSLGLPCLTTPATSAPITEIDSIAFRLSQAFEQKPTTRKYLCPLDYGQDLPSLWFDHFRVQVAWRSSPEGLRNLMSRISEEVEKSRDGSCKTHVLEWGVAGRRHSVWV